MTTTPSELAQDLRKRAEEKFQMAGAKASQTLSDAETKNLLHELQVHQIELEMQNDELRRTQGELDVERARYFDLYDLAPIGYLTVSDEGVVLKANLAAATMLGVVRYFLINKRFSQFFFIEDQGVYSQHSKRLIDSGELQNWEMRLKRFDGSHFWAELQSTLAHNGENWITLHDITERKQMAAAIQNTIVIQGALEYAENIVETVREPLLVLDSGLKILTANGNFYSTFKVTPEETIGNFIYDLGNHQWDIPKLRLLLEKIIPQNTIFNDYEVDHVFQSIGHKTMLLNARQIFRKDIGQHVILLALEDITVRKQLEANIQSLLEYSENIVEAVREPLVVLDSNLKIISVNGNFYSTFKVTPKETIGKFIYDLGNRQWDIPKLRLLLEEILPANSAFNDYEVDHVFQSVGRKTMLLNARQIFRKDVASNIILLAMQDITVRRQKALALDERNKELSCLYSIITLCNMPGISLDELLMKSVMRIPPASQFPEITEASIEMNGNSFQTACFKETPWMLASDITVQGAKIGQLKLCYLEERQASDEGPFQIHERHLLNAIAEKLSLAIERKQAETELQESNDRFNQLAAQRGTIVWEVDAQGLYTYISHVSEAVLGYQPNEIVGCMHFYDLHPESGREAFKNAAFAVFKRKETFNDLENCIQKKDGRLAWVTTYGSPILNSDGVLLGYRGSDTDITEKKSTIEQLIHSQKMESIGQLAGGLAHDLNNILSVVSGYTALAQLGMDKEQKQFSYLDEVIRATSRAASLTHSLLAYSRKQEMDQQRQNLNLLITTVGSFISRIIRDNIVFTLSLAAEPLGVNVDTVQIEQVLLNLATNARDAMPDGGTFTIATADGSMDEQFIATHGYGTVGRYAIITVTDSGHGMDQETKRKVFNPFFTTKEIGKGTGLGLAMVLGIIKQHGGFIDLRSEPGRGSVFQLYLPLVDSGESAAEPAEKHIQMDTGSGTILVAEDDEDTRNAVAEFLTRAGYTVITAMDGQDAVEKFAARKEEIELVISDVVMPRMSGKAASEEIR